MNTVYLKNEIDRIYKEANIKTDQYVNGNWIVYCGNNVTYMSNELYKKYQELTKKAFNP